MNLKVVLAVSVLGNIALGIYALRIESLTAHTSTPPPPASTPAPDRVATPDASPGTALAGSVVRRFTWGSVESPDYKQYIANLRSIGCPEETIRDIIRADVNKLYEEKKKQVRRAAPKFEYWKGDDFLRGAGRDAWMKMLALGEERDAVLRALGIEPDASLKTEKKSAGMDWMLDFLDEGKKAQILRLHRQLEDRLAMRARGSLDADGIAASMKERDAAIRSILAPEEARQYDLRLSPAAGMLRSQLSAFEPTEEEFAGLFRLRKDSEDQHGQPTESSALGADERRERRESEAASRQAGEEQIEQLLGAQRYSDYVRSQDPAFQRLHRATKQSDLSYDDAIRIYDLKTAVETRAGDIRSNQDLSTKQRDAALQAIRRDAEVQLRQSLGENVWESNARQNITWWLQGISPERREIVTAPGIGP